MAVTRKSPSTLALEHALTFQTATFKKTTQELGEGNSGSLTIYRYEGPLGGLNANLQALFNPGSQEVAVKKFHGKIDLNEIDKATYFYLQAKKNNFEVPYGFGLPLRSENGDVIGVAYKIIQYPIYNAEIALANANSEIATSSTASAEKKYASANIESYIQAIVTDSEYKRIANEIEIRTDFTYDDVLKLLEKGGIFSAHGKELLTLISSLMNSANRSIQAIHDVHVCHRDIACRNIVVSDVQYVKKTRLTEQDDGDERILDIKVAMVDFGHAQYVPSGLAVKYKNKKKAPIRTLSSYTIKTHQYREQDDMLAKRILFMEMMTFALNANVEKVLALKPDQTLQELGEAKFRTTDQDMLSAYYYNLWQVADLHKSERRIIIQLLLICLKEYLLSVPDDDVVLARESETQLFRKSMGMIARAMIAINKSELLTLFPIDKCDKVKKSDLEDFFLDVKRCRVWDLPEKETSDLNKIIAHAQIFEFVYKIKPRFDFYQRTTFARQHHKQQSDSASLSPPSQRRDLERRRIGTKRSSLFGSLPTPSHSGKAEIFAPMPVCSKDDGFIQAATGSAIFSPPTKCLDNQYTSLPAGLASMADTAAPSVAADTQYTPLPIVIAEAGRILDETSSTVPRSPEERREMRRLHRTVTFNFSSESSSSGDNADSPREQSSPRNKK